MSKKEKMLGYRKAFLNALYSASEYDAVALCFHEINLCIGATIPKNFAAEEINRLRRRNHKAYAEILASAKNSLLVLAQEKDEDEVGFEGFLTAAITLLNSVPCPEYIHLDMLRAIGLFFLLCALDHYISSSVQSMEAFGQMQTGPLNRNKHTGYLVYPRECSSIFSKSYKKSDLSFRTPITSTELGTLFKAFFVVKTEHFSSGIPRIVPVKRTSKTQEKLSEEEIIIASIPFIGFRTILFHNLEDDTPLAEGKYPSGSFYVEYSAEIETGAIRLVTELLEKAIEHQANLIIFPEYIMSERMREAIKAKITKLKPPKLELVFAGTTYEFDEKTLRGNNVLHVFNGRGVEIAKYYKYAPFNSEAETEHHGATIPGNGAGDWPFQCIELLSDPGKECILLDVENLGRILPSVCRDFIDGDYTDWLVKTFCPSFVVIPAWSHSVSSFDSAMNLYANTIHTVSLLCNSCDAVKQQNDKEIPIASFYMPAIVDNKMQANSVKPSRKADCRESCKECGGCIIIYKINASKAKPDFSFEIIKTK